MTLLEQLQNHKGSLLRLKTRLYWCESRGYDNNPVRVCLILDAAAAFSPDRRSSPMGPAAMMPGWAR